MKTRSAGKGHPNISAHFYDGEFSVYCECTEDVRRHCPWGTFYTAPRDPDEPCIYEAREGGMSCRHPEAQLRAISNMGGHIAIEIARLTAEIEVS